MQGRGVGIGVAWVEVGRGGRPNLADFCCKQRETPTGSALRVAIKRFSAKCGTRTQNHYPTVPNLQIKSKLNKGDRGTHRKSTHARVYQRRPGIYIPDIEGLVGCFVPKCYTAASFVIKRTAIRTSDTSLDLNPLIAVMVVQFPTLSLHIGPSATGTSL